MTMSCISQVINTENANFKSDAIFCMYSVCNIVSIMLVSGAFMVQIKHLIYLSPINFQFAILLQ